MPQRLLSSLNKYLSSFERRKKTNTLIKVRKVMMGWMLLPELLWSFWGLVKLGEYVLCRAEIVQE